VVVISPHLDDAVFGCGELLADNRGTTVVTVFADMPKRSEMQTEWDARCGFRSAEEAMTWRRGEDERALAMLGAHPIWLHFCDSQYGETPTLDHLATVLKQVLADLAGPAVLLPLGLFHSDHLLVHDASVLALRSLGHHAFLAYEDAPYRAMPGLLQQRLAALERACVRATPARIGAPPAQREQKQRAVLTYASQLRGFGPGGYDDLEWPERYWRLEEQGSGEAPDAR
jgi:LmbE family N-acetylglucosaminyl deacetylase